MGLRLPAISRSALPASPGELLRALRALDREAPRQGFVELVGERASFFLFLHEGKPYCAGAYEDERFVPVLEHPPLDLPRPAPSDPFAAERARAEHLCLWLACSRVLCRNSRHCHGRQVNCLAENGEPQRPLLESVTRGPFGAG